MFKKEAEEYAEKHAFRIPYDGSDKFYDDKDYECSKEGFQKGAEFGYSKSKNEAKEIIKGLLSCCRNYPQENAEKVERAEQFISEVEK